MDRETKIFLLIAAILTVLAIIAIIVGQMTGFNLPTYP